MLGILTALFGAALATVQPSLRRALGYLIINTNSYSTTLFILHTTVIFDQYFMILVFAPFVETKQFAAERI